MTRRVLVFALAIVLVAGAITPAAATIAEPADEPRRADLQIYQPHYVNSGVATEDLGNVTLYKTSGREIQIQPRNFNASEVVDVSIAEDVGTISKDRNRNVFVLDSVGIEGTFRITWIVDETVEKTVVEDNVTTTKTQTERRTYEAVIRTSDVDYAHMPRGRVEELRDDSRNWSEVEDLFGPIGSPSKTIEQKLQFGAKLVDAWNNPSKALRGDFGMAVQAVFFAPGGLIFFILWNIPHLVRSRRLRRENKELKEKIGDYEEIDDALDEIFTEKRKRYLKEKSWNDWFDDRTASWLRRNFAPEPWSGFRRIMGMLSPAHLNSIVAGAMLNTGRYVAIVDYDDPVIPDGGRDQDVDDDRDVVSARIFELGDQDVDDLTVVDSERVIESSDKLDEEIAATIDPTTLESDILRRHDVELRNVALPIGNSPKEDDFIGQLNVSIPADFESREHFAEVIETIIRKTAATEYSTDDGKIDPRRDLANFLMGFASIGGESYNQPYLRFVRDLMLHNLDRLDASKRMSDVVDESRDLGEQGDNGS